jgi:hypothetical protein
MNFFEPRNTPNTQSLIPALRMLRTFRGSSREDLTQKRKDVKAQRGKPQPKFLNRSEQRKQRGKTEPQPKH